MGVNRESYYSWKKTHIITQEKRKARLEILKQVSDLVLNEYRVFPQYGYRKMSKHLLALKNEIASERRVRLVYNMLGLRGLIPQFKTSRAGKGKNHKKYRYLLKDYVIRHVNQVWATDITYLETEVGKMYLVAIIDLYSRKILSWRLSNTMNVNFCMEALKEAVDTYGVPAIFNSDQGSQFTSNEFTSYLESLGVRISMTGKGRCLDNIIVERTWRTIKYEAVFLYDWNTMKEMRTGLGQYIIKFNSLRIHQGLDYKTPDEIYYNGLPIRNQGKANIVA